MNKEHLATYFRYLDNLRESGVTNMFGASLYLEETFDLKHRDAIYILARWMKTFDKNKTPEERANG